MGTALFGSAVFGDAVFGATAAGTTCTADIYATLGDYHSAIESVTDTKYLGVIRHGAVLVSIRRT